MIFKKLLFLICLLQLVPFRLALPQNDNISEESSIDMKKILNKKKITVVITDSGLGGMSVCAGVENKLKEANAFEEVNLIFFNALHKKGTGYNSMPNIEVKAEVFNEALLSMENNYSPDLILIACNTLSVVYPYTQFAQVSKTPVLGIVDFGVSMVLSELKRNAKSEVIILGTPTTIKSGTHKRKLIENGVDDNRVINQACLNLESEIQNAPESQAVADLINQYLNEAIQKLDNINEPIITALCCTHYGFSMGIFESVFKKLTDRETIILNPNDLMINSVILEENINKYPDTKINVSVVSRVLIFENEKESIGGLIKALAPLSAAALRNYKYNRELFEFHQ